MGGEKTSRTKRAGLHFPIHRVNKTLRVKMGNKRRFQKGVDVRLTALLEYGIERLLILSSDLVSKGNYIDAEHIHDAINDEHSELAGMYPKHVTGLY